MKFNMPQPSPEPDIDCSLRVGNVYACKGGGKTRYWIVVGLSERTVNVIGIDAEGQITSTGNYGVHVFDGHPLYPGRNVLGHVAGLDELEFDVTWFGKGAPK